MEWIRRWVRRHTRPVPRQKARLYHNRLSITYYLFAWSAAGVAFFTMFTVDSTALPGHLDVHVDPNAKNKPGGYQSIDRVRKASDDTKVKIVSMKNFTIESVESYEGRSLQQQSEDMKMRAREDFFGDAEGSPTEELDLSV